MKLIERIFWIVLVFVLAMALRLQKEPQVSFAAPKTPVIQVVQGGDAPCLAITHRFNRATGKIEPVPANDPLGIRTVDFTK